MGRKRKWRGSSALRYMGELEATLRSRMPEDRARAAALTSMAEYCANYGVYQELYERMVKAFGSRIPGHCWGYTNLRCSRCLTSLGEATRWRPL